MNTKKCFIIISFAFLLILGNKPVWSQKIYWSDTGTSKIQRANLDGSNVEDLVTGVFTPFEITLDLTAEKMYWTDYFDHDIQRANLDGSNVENLVPGVVNPFGIALDVADGKMYWTDTGTGKVQRADLDGSNVEDLVTGLLDPAPIALDVDAGKMYWADVDTDKIQRANLDGSDVEDLVTAGLINPSAIALDIDAGKMYWTDDNTGKIQRANFDGSNVEDMVTTGLIDPYAIALDLQLPTDSVFTYQGQLQKEGTLLNETCDLKFTLWTDVTEGLRVGSEQVLTNITPDDGRFTVALDFGEKAFYGKQRWLQIAVKGLDDPNFVTLSPRQQLTAAPYARYALRAGQVSWNNILNIPDGINDGVDNGAEDWSELTGIPPGFADNVDNIGSDGSDHTHSSLDAADGSPQDAVFVDNAGKVGIGTNGPEQLLHVKDGDAGVTPNSNSRLIVERDNSTFINILTPSEDQTGILFGNPEDGSAAGGVVYNSSNTPDGMQFRVNGNNAEMTIISNGNVGVGTTAPNVRLDVIGSIEYTGSITDVSDQRLKENIAPIEDALVKVQQIEGVSFNMKDTPGQRELGVLAQDVQRVLPEAVNILDPENGYLGVSYPSLIPVLLEAIKEQQKVVEEVKAENKSLKQRLNALEQRFQEQQSVNTNGTN